VIVRSAPDERFERDGVDLWRVQPIDVAEAVLGTEISVPTLDGPLTVKVAPGTQPDTQLRLRGKGLPRFGGRGRGDLYLRLAVSVPERLSAEERRLWERLRTLHGGRHQSRPGRDAGQADAPAARCGIALRNPQGQTSMHFRHASQLSRLSAK
jgi:molecular chaperone DnaJ